MSCLRPSHHHLIFAGLVSVAGLLRADPLSKKTDLDFFRDVPSRNLKGLATRSDGRLVTGPTLTEIAAAAPADLLWCLEPTADPAQWLVGTGPDGRILELTCAPGNASYAARDFAKLDDPLVFAVKRLADGTVLAGTSPKGAVHLLRDGQTVARVALPVDSIFDLVLVDEHTALAATGNPGRIYRIDLIKFAFAGVNADKITDAASLASNGITLFGEIRDRNVRRLVALADGRIAAGSSPKGNIYVFPKAVGAFATEALTKAEPVILQENRDAEVTDLLPQPNGDLYAAIVFASSSGESRMTPPPKTTKDVPEPPPPLAPPEKFGGRSSVVWFPADGFPEVLVSRPNGAFYRLARHGDLLIMAGGEQGELFGYDFKTKFALTFAGSISSQLTSLAPIAGAPGKFLILRNNIPGLAVLDFNATGSREAETRRLDLGVPALVGALRFNRLRALTDDQLALEMRVSNGSDEVEGWGPWTPLKSADGGWRADALRGRSVKLRLRLAAGAPATAEVDKGLLFLLQQNRRPLLQDFRLLTPNYGLIPAVEQPPPAIATINQVMSAPPKDDDAKRRTSFLNSQIVPSPGTQSIFWTVTDPDGDNLTSIFSVRRDGDSTWTDVAANTRDSFAQFDTAHLPDGNYFTRLIVSESAPRPVSERLTATFDTDNLLVDHTPPEILEATARRTTDRVILTVHGRDKLSLLDGIEVIFNNGVREVVEQPDDGIRDGREERFTLDVALAKVSNATSAEVTLWDAAGNGTSKRLTW
ncbi:MAG: hypothetical protein EXS32_11530 [Opitutus sp.]|nr:hypothetical protein [Opitutus sp.]